MKPAIALAALLLLTACASDELQQLQAACASGNLQACGAAAQFRQQRALMLGQALYQSGGALKQSNQPAYQPRPPLTCFRQGVFVQCY